MSFSQWLVQKILNKSGVKIGGSRPFDIRVNDNRFYRDIIFRSTLGAGESYMKHRWDSDKLAETVKRIMSGPGKFFLILNPYYLFSTAKNYLFNLGRAERSFEVGEVHYNLDYDLFESMLGENMTYSCGYWKDASDLGSAQLQKLDLVCKKLNLKPGMEVLEIGCGWGSFAYHAAKNYGVRVTGLTVAKKQADYAARMCENLPVKIVLKDWHQLIEKPLGEFDRVVSIAMFEAVWWRDYYKFMKTVHSHLKEKGFFLLHTIGKNTPLFTTDPWIQKYIFPNGLIPPKKTLEKVAKRNFHVWDWHSFGSGHYEKTLKAWHERFQSSTERIEARYGEEFKRMWEFYLQICEAVFSVELLELWQILMSKDARPDDYKPIR